MMYNKEVLIGRLVAAPELHKNQHRQIRCPSDRYINRYKDQKTERETDFVNVVWGNWLEPWLASAWILWWRDLDAPPRENGVMQTDRGPLPKFSVAREPRSASDAWNGGTGDLADIILEEEDLPFWKKAGLRDQLFDTW